MDKLSDTEQEKVQKISVEHTRKILGGSIEVLFYDVNTLYFEAEKENELHKMRFSKEERHKNPQIILVFWSVRRVIRWLIAYTPATRRKDTPCSCNVVANSGLMNRSNIEELERMGYCYVIEAKIKSENHGVKQYILSQPKIDRQMFEIEKGYERKLLVEYTKERARRDAYNLEKGILRLEKAYKHGKLKKENINKRGYNKFLKNQFRGTCYH